MDLSNWKINAQTNRTVETTLAPSFASLQLKKFELEFAVDPLFKKASSDFDEGGAKGLLLNHLTIDTEGRVVFDFFYNPETATSAGETLDDRGSPKLSRSKTDAKETEDRRGGACESCVDINLPMLGSKFFPDLDVLSSQDICPSLKGIDHTSVAGIQDFPIRKSLEAMVSGSEENHAHQLYENSGIFLDDDMAHGFDDIPGVPGDGFEPTVAPGFGQGGHFWASNAVLDSASHDRRTTTNEGLIEDDGVDLSPEDGCAPTGNFTKASLLPDGNHQDILSYFDNAPRKDWAGPENWRIRKLKTGARASSNLAMKRKDKEPFSIDFAAPLTETAAELIYTPASSSSVISLPKTQWKSKTRNLLPDDKHFNSVQLTRLFLKPRAQVRTRKIADRYYSNRVHFQHGASADSDQLPLDQFGSLDGDVNGSITKPQGDYDANFFQDDAPTFANYLPDDDGVIDRDEVFVDVPQGLVHDDTGAIPNGMLNSGQDQQGTLQDGSFGSQLITGSRRMRPEYVNYARVAKKVDVKRLKEDLWNGMEYEKV